jgi:hypothetical protein
MPKYSIGLDKIEMGDIAGDGGMSTGLAELGATVQDTMTLTNEDDQTQDFFEEESDDPVYSIVTQRGALRLNWSTYNIDVQNLQKLFGGTISGNGTSTPYTWTAPNNIPEKEQSLRITTKSGPVIEITRATMQPKFNWNLTKTQLASIDIVATVLTPTKANEGKMRIIEPL